MPKKLVKTLKSLFSLSQLWSTEPTDLVKPLNLIKHFILAVAIFALFGCQEVTQNVTFQFPQCESQVIEKTLQCGRGGDYGCRYYFQIEVQKETYREYNTGDLVPNETLCLQNEALCQIK